MGACVAGEGEDRGEVHLQDFVEVGIGEGGAGVPALDAGAVHQDADRMAVGENLRDEGGYICGGGEVGCVDLGFSA